MLGRFVLFLCLVVRSTFVWLFVVYLTVTKMFGRVFDLSLAVGRVFDCY